MPRLPDNGTLALDFTRPVDPAPAVSTDDVERVLSVLAESGEWLTAKQIAEALGDGYNDRKVRKVASAAAPRIVSYPGSPGYRLFERCTVEEIDHCINATESQGRDMIKRSILYRTAYHKRHITQAQPTR